MKVRSHAERGNEIERGPISCSIIQHNGSARPFTNFTQLPWPAGTFLTVESNVRGMLAILDRLLHLRRDGFPRRRQSHGLLLGRPRPLRLCRRWLRVAPVHPGRDAGRSRAATHHAHHGRVRHQHRPVDCVRARSDRPGERHRHRRFLRRLDRHRRGCPHAGPEPALAQPRKFHLRQSDLRGKLGDRAPLAARRRRDRLSWACFTTGWCWRAPIRASPYRGAFRCD